MSPTISVVTISFNQAAFLEECLRSVIDQRDGGVEYIVVDAGSSDDSREIIARHAEHIDHVIFEPDRGPADGLNKGFARARGSLLCYINADDRLAPHALRFARDHFSRHVECDVLCGAIRIIDALGKAQLRRRTADRFDLKRYAAGVCTVGQQATFFRRRTFEAAGRFNAANRICWDGELLVDMALVGARFQRVRRVLGDFRIYGESITGSGRFRQALDAEHARIAKKIGAHGVALWDERSERTARWLYKLNVVRHLDYLLAR